jgi:hypothetical protein
MVVALAAALAAAGCDSGNPTPTTPTPDPPTVTETFSGTLTVNGAVTYIIDVDAAGQVTARLASLAPDDTIVGLALGLWSGLSCNVVLANDQAKVGNTVVGHASGAGQLCVRVFDVGKITGPITFEVAVVHF